MEKKYIDVKPIIEAMIEHFNTLKAKAEIEYPEEIYGGRRFASDSQFANAATCVKFWTDKLAKEPTADVQEVRHAKWVWCGDSHVCSECEEFALSDKYTGEEVLSDYCPNCGAKMDGGEKNES